MGEQKTDYLIEIGKSYGYLTIREFIGKRSITGSKNTRPFVSAICKCGNGKIYNLYHLKSGNTKSCGCYNKERVLLCNKRHGLCSHPLYSTWSGMKERCNNKNSENYKWYGAIGVTVCKEWNDFKTFYDWSINNGWKKGLDLDKDILGDGKLYSPDTCCYVTHIRNSWAKKGAIKVLFRGEMALLSELCIANNVPYKKVHERIFGRGWSVEDSILVSNQSGGGGTSKYRVK